MTRTQRFLVTFTFSLWIVLYEQTNFFLETKPKKSSELQKPRWAFLALTCRSVQIKVNPRKWRRPTPRGKPVRQCEPAVGLCRKVLRNEVGGTSRSSTESIQRSPQRFSGHPFVCAVCHSKPRVLWMEIRRSRMSAFLTSYAHVFCTVTWRDLVLHVRKYRKRRSLLYRELYPFQKFAIPLENLQFHWSMYPYERGSVSTVVCHLFVVRVPERSAVCSQALCAVSGEASANGGYSQNGAGRGLRGTFAHGSMLEVWLVAWSQEKLTFRELLFPPFAWIRLGWWAYRRFLCSKNLKNQAKERVRARFFYFFSDRWQWAVWDSEQRIQHCKWLVVCTVTRTAVVGGKQNLRLGFVFYTEKSSTPCVLAVLVLCLRSLAFVAVSARPPRVCQIWLTRYGTRVQESAADVQLSIARLSNLTERKSSWRLKTHWGTCDCSVTPSMEISSVTFFFSEIPASDSARPSQVAHRRRY